MLTYAVSCTCIPECDIFIPILCCILDPILTRVSVTQAEGQTLPVDTGKAICRSLVDILTKGSSDIRKKLLRDYDLRQLDVKHLSKQPQKFDLDFYPKLV